MLLLINFIVGKVSIIDCGFPVDLTIDCICRMIILYAKKHILCVLLRIVGNFRKEQVFYTPTYIFSFFVVCKI